MNPISTAGEGSSIDINTLMAEFDKSSSEDRKINKASREANFSKRMGLLDKNISALKKQNDEMSKASKLGFVFGLISNLMNLATQVISAICPPLAPVFVAVNKALQGLMGVVSQKLVGDAQSQASKAATQAEEMKKDAESASHATNIDEERLAQTAEIKQQVLASLKQALALQQQAKEAAIRA